MGNTKTVLFSLFLISFLILDTGSTTRIVQVSDFQFNPANMTNVVVGDTIKWQWFSGFHTTTSTTIPATASSWDSPITQASPTFIYVVTVPGVYNYVCTPHSPGMNGSFTANPNAIVPISGNIPVKFNLSQNFPNPFNPVTNIKIDIPNFSLVKLTVFDVLGSQVEVLVNQYLDAGSYAVDWNAAPYSSGLYFYTMEAGDYISTRKMILVK